jgi:DNA invertase Pin-like site-specific DNA recombinase
MIRPYTQINVIYGYCRVSTKEQSKSGVSIETQQSLISEFVQNKYNRPVDEWFIDDGVSGTMDILERPASSSMTDVMDESDVIVCTRLDRLSRSTSDLLSMIPVLQETNITLFFCEQFGDMPIVYPKFEGEKGLKSRFDMSDMANKIMLMVLSAVAEIEHANIKDRFGEGKVDWASRGFSIGGSAPFGYTFDTVKIGNKTRKRLIEHPEEQRVLKSIYRLQSRGLGNHQIAKQINSLYRDQNMYAAKIKRILNRKYQGLSSAA